jgi:hypothetical protein
MISIQKTTNPNTSQVVYKANFFPHTGWASIQVDIYWIRKKEVDIYWQKMAQWNHDFQSFRLQVCNAWRCGGQDVGPYNLNPILEAMVLLNHRRKDIYIYIYERQLWGGLWEVLRIYVTSSRVLLFIFFFFLSIFSPTATNKLLDLC